jgi:hypothetical protein
MSENPTLGRAVVMSASAVMLGVAVGYLARLFWEDIRRRR